MNDNDELGISVRMEASAWKEGRFVSKPAVIASEVPFTIMTGDIELATLLVSPVHLKELTTGYLFTSGFITHAGDIREMVIDTGRWTAWTELARVPDPEIMRRRVYSASCGRCALYSSVVENSMRNPCTAGLRVTAAQISEAARWIENASEVFTETGGVHAAGFYSPGIGPHEAFEDVARHNAVDKAIGHALLKKIDMSQLLLVRTGRTSSEILFKTRRCGAPVTVSRGAPTHQAVLLAHELGITLVGFARNNGFTVYSHEERIVS